MTAFGIRCTKARSKGPSHRFWVASIACTLSVVAGGASTARAQVRNLDEAASRAFNAKEFIKAAQLFYRGIERYDNDPQRRYKAEYYVGRSLYRAGYLLAAYQFYGELVNVGERHPYFLKGIEGLLDVAGDIGDDTFIPSIIDRRYGDSFVRLRKDGLNTANYLVGMIAQRRGDVADAKNFLTAVRPESASYAKARYLLAIMAVKAARDRGAANYDEAIGYFTELEAALKTSTDETDKKLHRLSLLGLARAYYSQGDFAESIVHYEKVPRFSNDWYDAMFESGWAYFQEAKFGRALGMVHAVQSPYFDDRYRSESFVLKAMAYFQVCHFDRVNKTLDSFFRLYRPMVERLRPWLKRDRNDADLVDLVVHGRPSFPKEMQRHLARNPRFQKFLAQVREVDRELERARRDISPGPFKKALLSLLLNQRDQRVELTGRLVRAQLTREVRALDDLLNQADIIKLETTSAERKMLAAGKDITKGPRAKGPRPIIPDASYQYWAFQGEYWIDELGYYEHSIKDECVPEVFE